MTYQRTLQGIPFKVLSPSLYELAAPDDGSGICLVTVAFCTDSFWHIDVLMKKGNAHHRGPFHTRDEAVALLAGRRSA